MAPPTTLIATEALLVRARGGDRAAWGDLVHRYAHRVRVVLLAEGFSLAESQDLAQEAWASIWSKHQHGELSELQLPGLVIAQARFLGKDLRRRSRRTLVDVSSDDPVPPIDLQVVAAQQLRAVRAALAERPVQQQRIFLEAVDEQRPHADIAAREGLSLQRIRQILWEVRRALRSALEPDDGRKP